MLLIKVFHLVWEDEFLLREDLVGIGNKMLVFEVNQNPPPCTVLYNCVGVFHITIFLKHLHWKSCRRKRIRKRKNLSAIDRMWIFKTKMSLFSSIAPKRRNNCCCSCLPRYRRGRSTGRKKFFSTYFFFFLIDKTFRKELIIPESLESIVVVATNFLFFCLAKGGMFFWYWHNWCYETFRTCCCLWWASSDLFLLTFTKKFLFTWFDFL